MTPRIHGNVMNAFPSSSFKKFCREHIRWMVHRDFEQYLPENLFQMLYHHERHPRLILLRENNVRASFLFSLPDDTQIFIKRYKCRGLEDTLKYLMFPSKGSSEWKNLIRFQKKGLPVSPPLALLEKRRFMMLKDSCILVKAITPSITLNKYIKNFRNTTPRQRASLIPDLARLIQRMHQSGIYYRDLHPGNILLKVGENTQPEIFFVDLHRALCFKTLIPWMKIHDLAQLCNSVAASKTEKLRFLKEYCSGWNMTKSQFYSLSKKVMHTAQKMERRRLKSRSKRCMKNSTRFEVHKSWYEHYCGLKSFGKGAALAAIEQHKSANNNEHLPMVKKSPKSTLTFHAAGSTIPANCCVKGYRYVGFFYALKNIFRKSRAMKSWIAGNALLVRGINTPVCYAVYESRKGPFIIESYLITELLDGAVELNDYIIRNVQASKDIRNFFIRAFADALRNLHLAGIYHADLKSNNILVSTQNSEKPAFYFIDLDRVRLKKNLSFRERTNNLAQINASVSEVISAKDRLKFFHYYARGTFLIGERKGYYQEILRISRKKISEPYGVSFKL